MATIDQTNPVSRRAMFEHEFGYNVNEYGTITSPGKFENESWIAPIVYEWVLDGNGETVYPDCECEDECECGIDYTLFEITDTDRAELELSADTAYITLTESDQGFVNVREWTVDEYAKLIA